VIKREPHEDLYVSIGNAFRAAQRQIEDYDRERRRKVKHHEEMPRAIVSALFPEKGYGFLTTPDGREFYFHKNSVLDDKFKVLKVGMKVRFVEELGEKGAQASTVKVK
jgi:cold shock CspA family protein